MAANLRMNYSFWRKEKQEQSMTIMMIAIRITEENSDSKAQQVEEDGFLLLCFLFYLIVCENSGLFLFISPQFLHHLLEFIIRKKLNSLF